jgi:Glu-tRNA(Gln) amidotransferase subunit E-like FAD-binding protein
VSSNEYVRHFIDNIGLYDLYKQKHFERLVPDLEKKETAILEAICDKHCTNILEISEATEIDKKEVDMILKHAGLKKELAESKRVLEYEAVVKVYKDKVDEMPLPSEIAEATGMASITASKAGLYMRRFRDEVRKRRAREKHPELFA